MGRIGSHGEKLDDILTRYGLVDIISIMMYDEPGERDRLVLEEGLDRMEHNNLYQGDYFMLVEYIGIDEALALDVIRGWKITFVFVNKLEEEYRSTMAENLMEGFLALRVKANLIEQKEVGIDV